VNTTTRDRLLIPEKLYGAGSARSHPCSPPFDRVVSSGRPELVLVSGYSGIGKSSVVHELNRILVPPRGLFASGKFDQYKRDISVFDARPGLSGPHPSSPEEERRRTEQMARCAS